MKGYSDLWRHWQQLALLSKDFFNFLNLFMMMDARTEGALVRKFRTGTPQSGIFTEFTI